MNTYNLRSRNTEEIKHKLFLNQYAQLEAIVREWTVQTHDAPHNIDVSNGILNDLMEQYRIINEKYQSLYDELEDDMDFTDHVVHKNCMEALLKTVPILQAMYYQLVITV